MSDERVCLSQNVRPLRCYRFNSFGLLKLGDPILLVGGIRDFDATRFADQFEGGARIEAEENKNAGGDKSGPPDPGATMNCDGLPFAQSFGQPTDEADRLPYRCGDAAIGERKGEELQMRRAAEREFAFETELRDLLGLEQAHDKINSISFPALNLVLQPIAGARAWHDRQSSVGD